VIDDPVPAHTWFKVGTPSRSVGSTGLERSRHVLERRRHGVQLTPISGGGGAAGGYDANVTDVRWTLGGALGTAAAVNSGSDR
jgi:hypothetical protein